MSDREARRARLRKFLAETTKGNYGEDALLAFVERELAPREQSPELAEAEKWLRDDWGCPCYGQEMSDIIAAELDRLRASERRLEADVADKHKSLTVACQKLYGEPTVPAPAQDRAARVVYRAATDEDAAIVKLIEWGADHPSHSDPVLCEGNCVEDESVFKLTITAERAGKDGT